MARYHQSVCRLCRREGEKLFLKGDRCFKEKCALEKRNVPPGQHGKRRGRVIGYGAQLREKQKVKRIYGILERQFRNYFKKASLKKGITGEILLTLLERRLDNVVYRLGFATSRPQARQLVSHGSVLVNGRKVDVPNYQVKPADEITVTPKAAKNPFVEQAIGSAKGRGVPEWLELDSESFKGRVLREPKRSDILYPINEQLIVELYSK
ncbi:MAG: 30S ribosomal protein S4 [Acidobacteriota bacterium]|nr:30S ribosomal protein S4 [Thermoanaerobaculaceae bacterium]